MEANIVNLKTLFEPDISYRIPQFQRPYAWGENAQWKPLWDDVRSVARRLLNGKVDRKIRPHFMGAIVLQRQTSKTGEVTKKLVVDGQQRLTTLQLLIKATQQVFQSQDDTDRATRLEKLITNQKSYWGDDSDNEPKIRQSNLIDQAAFQVAIRSHYNNHQSQPWAISQAYTYLRILVEDWLNSKLEERTARADALEEALTTYLQIAVIDLDEDEEPHIVFETLNARGEPLKQSDLVKNTVMYEANVIDDAEKARTLWGMFEDKWWRGNTHEGRLDRIQIDRFLNYWVNMRTLKEVTTDRVASEFRDYIENGNKQGKQLSIETVAADIRKSGIIYKDLEESKIPEIYKDLKESRKQAIEIFLQRMKIMELGVVMPLLLWLCTSEVPKEQLSRSIEVLESYLVRRMLCGLSSNNLSRVFIGLMLRLEKQSNDKVTRADDIIIKNLSSQTISSQVWPNDHMLDDNLTTRPIRGTVARKKMILEAIEMSLRSDKSEPLGATDKLTVEHIMPQKWEEKHWPMPTNDLDNTEAEEAREKVIKNIKNIGNLTLTTSKLNASLSNGPWSEKRETLDKHSSLFLNKRLLENAPNHWNEEAIQERSAYLVEKIIQIWSSADKFTKPSA